MQYSVHRIPTGDGGAKRLVEAPGDFVAVLANPAGTNAAVRVGSVTADPIPLELVSRLGSTGGFQRVYLDFEAVPDGEILLVVAAGGEVGRFDPVPDVQAVRESPSHGLQAGALAVGLAAVALPSFACAEVLLQASPDNTVSLYVGDADEQAVQLSPGQVLTIPVSSTGMVYVRAGGAGQSVNWLARS